jgi:hypothetical protein
VTGKFKMTAGSSGEYRADLTGIAAKELSEAVYVAAAYKSGDTVWTSGVLGYSIGTYCSSQATKGGDIANLAMATAVYGYHIFIHFCIGVFASLLALRNAMYPIDTLYVEWNFMPFFHQGKASTFVGMCLQFIHHQFCMYTKITKKM